MINANTRLEFSGFPGRDSDNLRRLDYAGRVEWFRYRFNLVFLTPFRRLVALEGPDCYVWLCVMELTGAAIHALANLAIGQGSDRAKFTAFLDAYLPTFGNVDLQLDDPRGRRPNELARTPADHFYKFFRSGLAHSFCIDWGGIQHREEVQAWVRRTCFKRRKDSAESMAWESFPESLSAILKMDVKGFSLHLRSQNRETPFVRASKEPLSVCFSENPVRPCHRTTTVTLCCVFTMDCSSPEGARPLSTSHPFKRFLDVPVPEQVLHALQRSW